MGASDSLNSVAKKSFRNIPIYDKKGNIIDHRQAQAKLIQNVSDFKLVWEQIIQDFSGDT